MDNKIISIVGTATHGPANPPIIFKLKFRWYEKVLSFLTFGRAGRARAYKELKEEMSKVFGKPSTINFNALAETIVMEDKIQTVLQAAEDAIEELLDEIVPMGHRVDYDKFRALNNFYVYLEDAGYKVNIDGEIVKIK